MKRYIRRIDVVTFKLMGVLEEYRRRGIDALLYLEAVKAVYEKGYEWLDGSVTSELNPMIDQGRTAGSGVRHRMLDVVADSAAYPARVRRVVQPPLRV